MNNNDVYEFEAPKGSRIFRYGHGITTFKSDVWWFEKLNRWIGGDSDKFYEMRETHSYSSHAPCRTFKAFKSHIRRHREELQGCEVVFRSRYCGHDISIQL